MASTDKMDKKRKRTADPSDHANIEPRMKKPSAKNDIASLESSIQQSPQNYNNIAKLLTVAESETRKNKHDAPATVSLTRVFTRLLVENKLKKPKATNGTQGTGGKTSTEKQVVIVDWLRSRYTSFKDIVLRPQLLCGDHEIQIRAVTLTMTLVREEWAAMSNSSLESRSRNATFVTLVHALLDASSSEESSTGEGHLQYFVEKYAAPFDDVRHCTLEALRAAMPNDETGGALSDPESRNSNILAILSSLSAPANDQKKLNTFFTSPAQGQSSPKLTLTHHKKVAQETWLTLLHQRHLTTPQRKRILHLTPTHLIPWFPSPETLLDFLTDTFNSGNTSSTSLLALSGLFTLTQPPLNLDYPSFYPKLYSLLTPDLLHSKHRSRFFRNLTHFLNSTHLPSALISSFIKRLARLSLHAPPAGIIAVIPTIYNLLKKHPACTFMLHRVPRTDIERQYNEEFGADDTFDAEEPNPMDSGAGESCLWEVVALQRHWHPNVAALARVLGMQFTKEGYDVEDFLDHSYSSLIDAELNKEMKKEPVVEFEIPKKIFTLEGEEDGALEGMMKRMISDR
ncbi:MAG: hypothetical protein M1831_002842 [Alyxoria varia]|nr:MAG: hypothetical protein M1831_002842 [Alyxoria varia]